MATRGIDITIEQLSDGSYKAVYRGSDYYSIYSPGNTVDVELTFLVPDREPTRDEIEMRAMQFVSSEARLDIQHSAHTYKKTIDVEPIPFNEIPRRY